MVVIENNRRLCAEHAVAGKADHPALLAQPVCMVVFLTRPGFQLGTAVFVPIDGERRAAVRAGNLGQQAVNCAQVGHWRAP